MALSNDTDEAGERALMNLRQARANLHAATAELSSNGFHSVAPDELVAAKAVGTDVDLLIESLQRDREVGQENYERIDELIDRQSRLASSKEREESTDSEVLRDSDRSRGLEVEIIVHNTLPSFQVLEDDTVFSINNPRQNDREENWNWRVEFGREITWRGEECERGRGYTEYYDSKHRAFYEMIQAMDEYADKIAADEGSDKEAVPAEREE